MGEHRVELKWDITASCELPDDGGSWRLENVSGKLIANGDDILTYRLVYSFPQGKRLGNATLIIKVWPELPEHGRRQGRPEAGFMMAPPSRSHVQKPGNYYVEPTHVVTVATSSEDAEDCVTGIYFSLEDCNYEPGGPPLWRLSVNESTLLSRLPVLKGRWIPLPAIHPDPAVDPGVPIHMRPQHSPRWYWYRNECAHYAIFKGKISASRMFDFIAGRFFNDRNMKGSNNLTRFGRGTEAKVILTHLLSCTYVASECGTYPHPTIEDSCGTADAFLEDTNRTFTTVPGWVQKKWLAEPAHIRDAIKWVLGLLEVKTMLKQDFKRLGPVMKPEHLCQMYWAMLCTGRVWGEYIRSCHETKESRVFHVYMIPALARRLEHCVARMQREMIAGTPYETACESEENHELVDAFRRQV